MKMEEIYKKTKKAHSENLKKRDAELNEMYLEAKRLFSSWERKMRQKAREFYSILKKVDKDDTDFYFEESIPEGAPKKYLIFVAEREWGKLTIKAQFVRWGGWSYSEDTVYCNLPEALGHPYDFSLSRGNRGEDPVGFFLENKNIILNKNTWEKAEKQITAKMEECLIEMAKR